LKAFFKVVAPEEARRILLEVGPVGTEKTETIEARGRVLAEDLHSQVDLPHFHRAGMDGYAVRARDTFGASASLPAYLKVTDTVAGSSPPSLRTMGAAKRSNITRAETG